MPDVIVVVAALVFCLGFAAVKEWGSVNNDRTSAELQKNVIENMRNTVTAAGEKKFVGDYVRTMAGTVIDQFEDGKGNGNGEYRRAAYHRPDAQPRNGTPANFPQPSASEVR
jgi:hypothetical protein